MIDRAIALLIGALSVIVGVAAVPSRYGKYRPLGFVAGGILLVAAVVVWFLPEKPSSPTTAATTTVTGNGNCVAGGSGNSVNCVAAPVATPKQSNGAYIWIEAHDPEHFQDGLYDFPIIAANIGNLPVDGYLSLFAQKFSPDKLSSVEENEFMTHLEDVMQHPVKGVISPETIQGTGSTLGPNLAMIFRQPNARVNEQQYKQIILGNQIVYYGFSMVYSDDNAKRDNILYFAERCMYYDRNIPDYVNCVGHNFSKNHWPFK